VLTVLAVAVFVAALLVIGLDGLIPFGLLLAFSTGQWSAGVPKAAGARGVS
jgi:hypothetical protein